MDRRIRMAGFHSGHEGYAVILEELDELWEHVRRDDTEGAGLEAVQVAAMALRFLVELCDESSGGGNVCGICAESRDVRECMRRLMLVTVVWGSFVEALRRAFTVVWGS